MDGTDRHDEADSRFSPFCEKRLKSKANLAAFHQKRLIKEFFGFFQEFVQMVRLRGTRNPLKKKKATHICFESFVSVDYTHKQGMLMLLKKGKARFQVHGMGCSTCGSSIELFLWERTAEWEIKTSWFHEEEKKPRCKRKRCRVKERDGEIAVRQELPVCQQRSTPHAHTHTHTHTHTHKSTGANIEHKN